MKKTIQSFVEDIKKKIKDLNDPATIEKLEVEILGRKGAFHHLLKQIKSLPEKERPAIGKFANEAKGALTDLFQQAVSGSVQPLSTSAQPLLDVTQPGIPLAPARGHHHPLSIVKQELAEIFLSMNYQVVEGPELDTEWEVFEALNIPPTHPARDIQDTFFVNREKEVRGKSSYRWVMRTHTSNMQVRVMEKMKPPLRSIAIGRCFRNEATDASHEHTFYQLEGFAVDEHVSVANLVATLKTMLESFFRRKVNVRLRPGYFPFVEPGFELDCSCLLCGGKGCSVCKHSGWIEMLGCGLIHPNVYEAVGYPKGKYTGFAFGMGIERLAILRYGIKDIRLFESGDLRFLNQFE